MQDIKRELREIADNFYQNRNIEGIQRMPAFIEVLTGRIEQLNEQEQMNYIVIMKNLLGAYEQKEYVMVADILNYEVTPLLD